jgi:ABC-2 type transport system ATP-binding protein
MGKTIIIRSQILPDLLDMCNTVGVIERGELLYSGPWTDLVKRVRSGTVVHVGVASHAEQAAALLSQEPNVAHASVVNGLIELSLQDGVTDWSFIPAKLVAGNYRVTLLREEEVNLETAFMRLTKGIVQ